ncbi:Membrane-associated phospholipid phosphatase [Neolewinella agarilytica]|uniref:Membrane-associated phospholipid phosphatase n=2 Tax=Neolewinella agarilytica TaxID=478744 RepID=A0A1H9CW93_9BACT|nr:Membrane-associated phospholipid phosphatase [Neolewinella agarilytica]
MGVEGVVKGLVIIYSCNLLPTLSKSQPTGFSKIPYLHGMLQTSPNQQVETSFSSFLRNNWLFIGGTMFLLLINGYLWATSNQGDTLIAINRLRSPFWDTFFKLGTQLAEPVAYVVVLIMVSAYSYRRGIFTVVAGATAGIVAGVLKLLFAQARPMRWFFDNYEEIWHSLNHFEEAYRNWSPDSSFPSGHATSAFALYGFLTFSARRGKLWVALLCFGLAVLVAFSRMYLLYHFLRDVTVGAGLGLCLATIVYLIQHRLFPRAYKLDRGWLSFFDKTPAARRSVPPPE